MKVTAENYAALKGFFGWMVDHVGELPSGLPVEAHPMAVLAEFERKSAAMARKSLQMGIGDTLERSELLDAHLVTEIDQALSAKNLPTLTTVRLEFSKKIESIMTRGRVRNEAEYYALRNVVEGMQAKRKAEAWLLLDDYEARI